MIRTLLVFAVSWTFAVPSLGSDDETISPERAVKALQRAVDFFRAEVSVEGGYLWRHAGDFSEREGELPASPTTVWVQSPGTPTVGAASLVERLTSVADAEVRRVEVFQTQQPSTLTRALVDAAAHLVQTQDARGAWVEPAYFRARIKISAKTPSLSCRTFATNTVTFARYIAGTSAKAPISPN